MMLWFFALMLSVAALATGCGSGDDGPEPMPRAATAEEWAGRVVDRIIRPMNRDIEVLGTLDDPQTLIYIQTEEQTLEVLDRRLNDMAQCNAKLDAIGDPPATEERPTMERVESLFREACDRYERVTEQVIPAVKLLSSGREEEFVRGNRKLREAGPDAAAGAEAYDKAVLFARAVPEFQAQGLQPPP